MRQWLVAVALIAACHGKAHRAAPPPAPARVAPAAGSAQAGSDLNAGLLPALPRSPDGADELRGLDQRITIHQHEPWLETAFLLQRAGIEGRVEDYVAALAASEAWITARPKDAAAWKGRVHALTAVHRFADARAVLAHVPEGSRGPLETALDEATGHYDKSLPARADTAKHWPSPANLGAYGGALAQLGRFDEALAQMTRAAAAVHDNSPELLSWLLFQWGRVYELKGEPAAARTFYEAARARMPGALEATAHLAQAMIATGDGAAARPLVEQALAANRHPALLALAAQLAPDGAGRAKLLAEAKAAWERYVQVLPLAWSDHAARFYLGVGADPARALVLARANLANRDTPQARALVVEAALAAKDPAAACKVVDPLIAGPGTHAEQFAAWRALAACHRDADAAKLAAKLGIGG